MEMGVWQEPRGWALDKVVLHDYCIKSNFIAT